MAGIPKPIETALKLLSDAGFEAYIVGGCVRDKLLGRIPSDYDITTNALPEQTKNVFQKFKCIDVGIQHGTVVVMIDSMQIEITTYRIDGEYTDKRHPESVSFSSKLKDDLSRRDFTINAMACDENDEVIDCYGGQDDLRNKIIKCVGDPEKRFGEDALRIMRALRFASQLEFTIDPLTEKYIFELKDTLKFISAERLRIELDKLLCGKSAFEILMKYHQVIEVFIPELADEYGFEQHSKYHRYTVQEHTFRAVKNSPFNSVIRLTMLLHDISKPECFTLDEKGNGHFKMHPEKGAAKAELILKRLKYDNKTIKTITSLIKYHDFKFRNISDIKKIMSLIGNDLFFTLIDVQKADADSKDGKVLTDINDLEWLRKSAEDIIKNNECLNIKDMNINGNDLIEKGFQGNQIGFILNVLLQEILENKIENNYDSLIKRALEIL